MLALTGQALASDPFVPPDVRPLIEMQPVKEALRKVDGLQNAMDSLLFRVDDLEQSVAMLRDEVEMARMEGMARTGPNDEPIDGQAVGEGPDGSTIMLPGLPGLGGDDDSEKTPEPVFLGESNGQRFWRDHEGNVFAR